MKHKFLVFGLLPIVLILGGCIKTEPDDSPEESDVSIVGLWEECDSESLHCATGLECEPYENTGKYRCVQYLEEGAECGLSVAKLCREGLSCEDTDETRQVCSGDITLDDDEEVVECFEEPFQICMQI